MPFDRREFVVLGARGVAGFAALQYLGACRAGAGAMSATTYSPAFTALRDQYFLRTLAYNPVTATYLGADAYDPSLSQVNGTLRDFRPETIAAEVVFYRDVAARLGALPPADAGSPEAIDRAVLGAQIAFLTHQYGERRYHERAVDTYAAEPFRGVDWQMQQMTDAGSGRLGTEAEWQLVVQRVNAIPAYLTVAEANLKAGVASNNRPDPRMITLDGISAAKSNAEYFRTTLPKTAAGYLGDRPFAGATQAALAGACTAAADAWTRFGAFLTATFKAGDDTDRYATGEPEYNWRLEHCLAVRRTAAELWEYGDQQVALYEDKIFRVAEQIARAAGLSLPFGTDAERRASVRAVMDRLSKDAPKSDDELLAWYIGTGERAVRYGRDHGLFDVPQTYKLDVVFTPPVLQSTIDAAYYPAPPFKKTGVGRFYLSPTGNDPATLAQNNRSSVATTAVHEGFPGHDWHYKYMTEHTADISNIRWLTPGAVEDSSSMWEDSMASEGWALYAEELMAEPVDGRPYGFYEPGEYLYMLQGQLMRAVRVRVDVGIHTGRMSFDDAVDYFAAHVEFVPDARKRAAREPVARAAFDTADRAIYRYSKWPTQAITYNLGKGAIVALRDDVRRAEGAGFSAKAFHEKLMRQGTIPAGYYREAFLKA